MLAGLTLSVRGNMKMLFKDILILQKKTNETLVSNTARFRKDPKTKTTTSLRLDLSR